jgi:hypothetical protein
MKKTANTELWALIIGILFGAILALSGVWMKQSLDFKSECDGVVVSRSWSFDQTEYCVDPSAMREDK